MVDPTKTGLMGSDEVEKIDPAQERALAGQGGPLPPELMFEGDGALESPEPSDDTASGTDFQGLVDEVFQSELADENSRVHTVNRKPFNKTLAVVLGLGSVTCVGALLLFGLTSRRSPTVAEEPEEEEIEELVFQDDSARLRSQLALQDQQTAIAELEAQKTNLVVEEDPEETVVSESAPPPARPVSSSPPPRPAPRPAPPSPPRPVSTPSVAPVAAEPPIDPFERWSQLAQLGTKRAGEEQIGGAIVADSADGFAQAATVGVQDPSGPFQSVSIGSITSQALRQVPSQPQILPRPSVQPALAQPGFQASIRPQLQVARPALGESALVASTPGAQGILDWQRQRQAQPSPPAPIQPELGTQVEATIVAPMAWDLASGANQSPDLGAGRFVIELDQDLTDPQGRVGLPKGATLIAQASTVSPDNQLVQASVIAVVYPAGGQTVQQTIPEGALLVQGQGAEPLMAQRLNDLGPNLAAEDLLVGTLSALGQAGAVLNQPREEFRSAASGDSTSSTVIRTTRNPNLLGGMLEGFGSTISDRIQRRSEQNTQANIDANTVAVLPEGMTVTVVVNSFLEIAP